MLRVAFILIFSLIKTLAISQNGLESIIVEKYYISDANDTASNKFSGKLPIGSTTYRIFVDMLPGYRFHAAYGDKNHELKIETTTQFFNSEDLGNKIPNVIPRRSLKKHTNMLDSWLSVGAAGEDYYGVLKEQDDEVNTLKHDKLLLQNTNPLAGIPIKNRDGLMAGNNVPRPSFFRIDSLTSVFNNQTTGSVFSTNNGGWGCLGGSVSPDSLTTNRVLIAQLTTDGVLSFELNIQIGKRNEPYERYVAINATGKEIQSPYLIYKDKELSATKSKKNQKKNKS